MQLLTPEQVPVDSAQVTQMQLGPDVLPLRGTWEIHIHAHHNHQAKTEKPKPFDSISIYQLSKNFGEIG